jgi:WXG100 family type VII secretion target
MATYTVNMSNVAAVAEEMNAIAGLINTLVQGLDDASTQHLAEWTSSARDQYNVCKAQWDAAAQDMATQAQKAQASLSSINDAYANAEYQGLGLWGQ